MCILTFDRGGEAKSVKAVEEAMPLPVASQTWSQVHAPAAIARVCDWILHCAVSQPASVTPVQPLLPRREELLKRGQCGILVLTRLLGPQKVKMVASLLRVVGEHHTCGRRTFFFFTFGDEEVQEVLLSQNLWVSPFLLNNSIKHGIQLKNTFLPATPLLTLQLQLHRHALVLQAVDHLAAVPARVVELQLVDDQGHVARCRASQAHTAPEAAVAAVTVSHGNHNLSFPAGGCRRGRRNDGIVGEPGPLDPGPAWRRQLGLVMVVTGKSDAAPPGG